MGSRHKYRAGAQESKSLDAATALGNGKAISVQDYESVNWLIVGGTGVTLGAVVIESAHDPAYGGTWKVLAGPVTVVADTALGDRFDFPPGGYVRARVSTAVNGGGVTVYVNALGDGN